MPKVTSRCTRRVTALGLLVLAGCGGVASDDVGSSAKSGARTPPGPPADAALPLAAVSGTAPRAFVSSTDGASGTPTFLWGARTNVVRKRTTTPELAARAHLESLASRYKLSREAVASARATQVRDDGSGAVLVVMRQKVGGIDVLERNAKVLMDRGLSLVVVGGSLHPAGFASGKLGRFALDGTDAIARAIDNLYGTSLTGADLAASDARPTNGGGEGEYRSFVLSRSAASRDLGVRLVRPARARRVYFPVGERLVPAYKVEIFAQAAATPSDDAYALIVAADDGRVLRRTDLTQHADFTYRVFADPTPPHRPMDGPVADFTPYPASAPSRLPLSYAAPSLITIDGFNVHRDPWLAPGATETRGNNADAYIDDGLPDGFSAGDLRASVTAPGVFDRAYDTSLEPVATNDQKMAAVTSAFYITNWLHDEWYDKGFDETAGNAQASNYGRGGREGDALRVEVQDAYASGSRNNANAQTPDDGVSPRLQFYVFDPPAAGGLTLAPGGARSVVFASFGPSAFNVAGTVTLANDGVFSQTDACEPITNGVAGTIVLADRGNCTFRRKAYNAQNAGAIGVIIASNSPEVQTSLGDEVPPTTPAITIPTLGISQVDGNSLKAALAGGAVTATLSREYVASRDSALDATIVAHEWGHYLHNRLVECSSQQCRAQGEGWGDFVALHMMLRPADDLAGAFAVSQYAAARYSNDPGYFGIRRLPYSTDFAKNGLTFKHISDGVALPSVPTNPSSAPNSQVHNAGEVWGSMLFEAYVALQKRATGAAPAYSFDEARTRMARYVVGGMKLAPALPTFTEQRDAILAVAAAADTADFDALVAAFARRGAGTCAVSASRDSTTFAGVVESFDVKPIASIESVIVDDAVVSCDSDGYIDSGETGRVVVRVANSGHAPLTDGVLTVTSNLAGTTFPKGTTLTVPALAPFASTDVVFEVAVAPSAAPIALDLRVELSSSSSCTPTTVVERVEHANVDEKPASSNVDDVEGRTTTWTAKDLDDRTLASSIWKREAIVPGARAWHGVDFGAPSDTALESPAITVGAAPFSVTFSHRYEFELDGQAYDGAVVEVSVDGGEWVDASTFSSPQYGGTIGDFSGGGATNVLKGRQGYVGQSAGWPARTTETLDFGTALANKSIKLRFRIGTDDASGAYGWEIDDITLAGATNTPFASRPAEDGVCTYSPAVNAGADQKVKSGALVTLDGSADPANAGGAITLVWTQTDGPAVTLSSSSATKPTFTAPVVTAQTKLTFELEVHEGPASAADTVDVVVEPEASPGSGPDAGAPKPGEDPDPTAPPAPGADGGTSTDALPANGPLDVDASSGGGGCRAASAPAPSSGITGLGGLALAALSLVTRRRRAR